MGIFGSVVAQATLVVFIEITCLMDLVGTEGQCWLKLASLMIIF